MKKNVNKEQIDDLERRWKLALADYQNLQRRYDAEKSDFVAFANSNLILKLLPVVDHLKLAGRKVDDQGLNIVVAELERVLKEEGLEEIGVQDQLFDPTIMEAVETVDGAKDTVVGVVTEGYTLKGKLLRPTRVQVGKGETNKPISNNEQ